LLEPLSVVGFENDNLSIKAYFKRKQIPKCCEQFFTHVFFLITRQEVTGNRVREKINKRILPETRKLDKLYL